MKSSTAWDRSKRICENCSRDYEPTTKWQKTCSYVCGYTKRNQKRIRGRTNFQFCARCGKSLENRNAKAIYCSKTCKSMDHNFKHRSKTRVTSVARRMEIYLRDSKKCYLCHAHLEENSFELDHLVPVARGGDNSTLNLAVSCRSCNRSRGDRIGIEQLLKLNELRFLV